MDTVDNKPVDDSGEFVNKELSLIEAVTHILTQANVVSPAMWMAAMPDEALESKDLNIQRFAINRRFTAYFTTLQTPEDILDTRNARGCLMNGECPLDDWMRLFKTVVVPCLIKHNLLTTHN